jgi:hypothetical protein
MMVVWAFAANVVAASARAITVSFIGSPPSNEIDMRDNAPIPG